MSCLCLNFYSCLFILKICSCQIGVVFRFHWCFKNHSYFNIVHIISYFISCQCCFIYAISLSFPSSISFIIIFFLYFFLLPSCDWAYFGAQFTSPNSTYAAHFCKPNTKDSRMAYQQRAQLPFGPTPCAPTPAFSCFYMVFFMHLYSSLSPHNSSSPVHECGSPKQNLQGSIATFSSPMQNNQAPCCQLLR